MMTLEQFDKLQRRDFENGAVLDEIRGVFKQLRAALEALNRCRQAVAVEHLAKCLLESERNEDLARVGFAFPRWDAAGLETRRLYLDAARAVRNRLLAFAPELDHVCELQSSPAAKKEIDDGK